MNLTVVELIKLGRKYMLLWPQRPELFQYFKAYYAVNMTRLLCRFLPPLAVFLLFLPVAMGNYSLLPQFLVYVLFTVSLPVQALVMLGTRADKYLPPSLAQWYKEGVARYNEQGGDIKLTMAKPRYIDLAHLINITYQSR